MSQNCSTLVLWYASTLVQKCRKRFLPEYQSTRVPEYGFTLIEVLIGVAILAFIMTAVWITTGQTIQMKERVEKRGDVYHEARVVLAKVAHDLSMSFLIAGDAHWGKKNDHPAIKASFRGTDSGEEDSLYFASMAHLRLYRSAKESETAEVGYKVEPNPEESGLLLLSRRESPWLDDKPEEGGDWILLTDRLKGFDVEYYDGVKKEWSKEWNSETDIRKDRLPRAVRVTLKMVNPDNPEEPLPFQTVALVEMYKNGINF